MKANLLRLRDVRDAYRLIGECRDLGRDPVLWQQRLVDGVCSLVGVPATTGGEGDWSEASGFLTPRTCLSTGFDECALTSLYHWQQRVGTEHCPIFRALWQGDNIFLTRSRRQLVVDRDWYRSESYLIRSGCYTDHQMTSLQPTLAGATLSALALHRARGEPDFTARELQLVDFLHTELAPLVGRALASVNEPRPSGLSRRVRQTLACLLEGDSEKEVAARLRLRPATAHQYVTALYRHFGVHSRAQLLAYVLRRVGREGWDEFFAGNPERVE